MRRMVVAAMYCSLGWACGGSSSSTSPASGVGGAGSQSGAGAPAAGAAGASGQSTAGSGGSSAAGAAGAPQQAAAPRLATAVTLSEVAVFQAVKVTVAKGGADAKRNAPVVANRALSVRAYVAPGAGFTPRKLRGELVVDDGATEEVLSETRDISGASSETQPSSVFTFDVAGARVTRQTKLSVRIIDDSAPEVAGATPSAARYPMDGGKAPLGARALAGALRVMLVPLRYDTDGSKRLPDTSAARLAELGGLLRAVYPVADVQVAVHDAVPWTQGLSLTGNVKFGSINGALVDLREKDGAADDVYYYGLINPASSFSAYCGGSCVTGQSYVVDDPTDASSRVGSGVGFAGEDSAWTLAHELGHMHGREHAPCDTDGWDPSFPYSDGGIGVFGLDQRVGALISPSTATDVMGYCDPLWVSDYTFSALFDRLVAVNGEKTLGWQPQKVATWSIRVDEEADGTLTWGPASQRRARGASDVSAHWLAADGATLTTTPARRARLAHGGATWLVPLPPEGSVAVELAGRILPLP